MLWRRFLKMNFSIWVKMSVFSFKIKFIFCCSKMMFVLELLTVCWDSLFFDIFSWWDELLSFKTFGTSFLTFLKLLCLLSIVWILLSFMCLLTLSIAICMQGSSELSLNCFDSCSNHSKSKWSLSKAAIKSESSLGTPFSQLPESPKPWWSSSIKLCR